MSTETIVKMAKDRYERSQEEQARAFGLTKRGGWDECSQKFRDIEIVAMRAAVEALTDLPESVIRSAGHASPVKRENFMSCYRTMLASAFGPRE